MSRLGAIASRTVGRTLALLPDGRRAVVLRVTGQGLTVRTMAGQTLTGITAGDIARWLDD